MYIGNYLDTLSINNFKGKLAAIVYTLSNLTATKQLYAAKRPARIRTS